MTFRRLSINKAVFIGSLLLFFYTTGLYQYICCLPYSLFYEHHGPSEQLSDLISQYKQGLVSPVTRYNFKFTYNSENKCNDEVKVLLVIKSRADNFEGRDSIRVSWGNETRFSNLKRVFVLGKPKDYYNQPVINNEASVYKDIVQGDFIDAYSNVTIKTLMTLHWVFHYCNSEYIVYLDDDLYVSTKNIFTFLQDPSNYPYSSNKFEQVNIYAGAVYVNHSPIRWIFNKFYIPLKDYPYSRWPPFITGSLSILSRQTFDRLYYGTLFTKFLKFDDVFLGMAAKKAGLTLFNIKKYHNPFIRYRADDYKYIIAAHEGINGPKHMLKIWSQQYALGHA